MFDVYLRAYKDTRLAKQLTKQIIDNMLSRLHIGGRAFAERLHFELLAVGTLAALQYVFY